MEWIYLLYKVVYKTISFAQNFILAIHNIIVFDKIFKNWSLWTNDQKPPILASASWFFSSFCQQQKKDEEKSLNIKKIVWKEQEI